jgi:hypothetical protein
MSQLSTTRLMPVAVNRRYGERSARDHWSMMLAGSPSHISWTLTSTHEKSD